MPRELPRIDICGDAFFVYIRLNEIRQIEWPYNSIRFNQMQPVCDDLKYRFWYDKKNKCLYTIVSNAKRLPEHVVCIEIPYELKLDPIGVAEKFGVTDKAFLEKFKPENETTATIIPLKETGIPQHLINNEKGNSIVGSLFKSKNRL